MKVCIQTNSPQETAQLGEKLAGFLRGGEVLELVSDLGGGKTTFSQGIVKGLGSSDAVTSPTFTISNVYHGSTLDIHHYDFYRLGELGLMSEELQETLQDLKIVSIVEWAGEAHDILPPERLIRIEIRPTADNEQQREIIIEHDGELAIDPADIGAQPC